MARITVEEVYNGAKYDVMSAAMAEYLRNGCPPVYDERTWLEMLLVKHALIAAMLLKKYSQMSALLANSRKTQPLHFSSLKVCLMLSRHSRLKRKLIY